MTHPLRDLITSTPVSLGIVLCIVLLFIIKDMLFWLYVLQLKEYRRDKLKDFFLTAEGYKTLFSKKNALRLTMLFGLIAYSFFAIDRPDLVFWQRILVFNILFIIVFIDIVPLLISLRSKKLKKPEWTMRMRLLIYCIVIAIGVTINYLRVPSYTFQEFYNAPNATKMFMLSYSIGVLLFYSLVIQLLLPILVLIAHLIISPIAWFEKKRILSSAQKKVKTLGHLTTIGISGSYGKSSIKMLLSQLLNKKEEHHEENVLSTPGNINTEIGISQYVLSKLNKAHQYFICEFGTYQIGESKLIGEIVNQKIGFLTGLNNQHVGLFGSLMNAISAETEILIKLRENKGTLYANRDDHLVRSLAFDGVQLIKYSISDPTADAYVSDIIGEPGKYEFTLRYGLKNYELGITNHEGKIKSNPKSEVRNPKSSMFFKTDLIGKHNILNLAGVLACCLDQGIAYEILYEHAKHLAQYQKTLSITQLATHNSQPITLIDDTYNINQNGVKAGLDLLSEYKGKKIVFIDEIIELGHETEETHKQLGQTLAQYDLDAIYLTGKNYGRYIEEGLKSGKAGKVVKNPDKNTIKELLQDPATIIFLGRGTQVWLEKLKDIG